MSKEIWLEGSFAGEIQVENRESGLAADDEVPGGAKGVGTDDAGDGGRGAGCRNDGGERRGGNKRGARSRRGAARDGDDRNDGGWDDDEWVDDGWDDDEWDDDWPDDLEDDDDDDCFRNVEHGAPGDRSGLDGKARKRPSRNKELGRRGEQAAARYLEQRGLEVLELNYMCPFGEADIVARDGETLVFVEVKTRSGIARGFPSEAVDERKRARYEKIAAWFLQGYGPVNIPVRFDVIAIMVIASDRAFIRHYVNAFGTGL